MLRICLQNGHFGKGIFLDASSSSRKCQPNQIVFREAPVEAVALSFSTMISRLCAFCLRPVETLPKRVMRILSLEGPNLSSALKEDEVRALEELWNSVQNFRFNKCSGSALALNEKMCSSCLQVVCSSDCYALLLEAPWHRVTCTSLTRVSGTDYRSFTTVRRAWCRFLKYAKHHHEGFLLAARLICRVVDTYESNGLEAALVMKTFLISYRCKTDLTLWATIHSSKKIQTCHRIPNEFEIQYAQKICVESFKLLNEYFELRAEYLEAKNPGSKPSKLHLLHITFDYYVQILIQFEYVNADIALEDPMKTILLNWTRVQNKEMPLWFPLCQKIIKKAGNILYPTQQKACNDFGELVSNAFPDIIGYSYCPLLGFINHSCCPNVVFDTCWATGSNLVGFLQWSSKGICSLSSRIPLFFKIVALKTICPGEELFLSYIDETLSLAQRTRLLKFHYDFVCRCSKCLKQAKKLLKEKKSSGSRDADSLPNSD